MRENLKLDAVTAEVSIWRMRNITNMLSSVYEKNERKFPIQDHPIDTNFCHPAQTTTNKISSSLQLSGN